jgi:hypothetical protein
MRSLEHSPFLAMTFPAFPVTRFEMERKDVAWPA